MMEREEAKGQGQEVTANFALLMTQLEEFLKSNDKIADRDKNVYLSTIRQIFNNEKKSLAECEEILPLIRTAQKDIVGILRDNGATSEDKMTRINTTVNGFAEAMNRNEGDSKNKPPGFTKEVGVAACRLLGAIAGLLLTPFMPFHKFYEASSRSLDANATDVNNGKARYFKAFGSGLAGFIVGTLAAPYYAMKMGKEWVDSTKFISEFQTSKDIANLKFKSSSEASKLTSGLFKIASEEEVKQEAISGAPPSLGNTEPS